MSPTPDNDGSLGLTQITVTEYLHDDIAGRSGWQMGRFVQNDTAVHFATFPTRDEAIADFVEQFPEWRHLVMCKTCNGTGLETREGCVCGRCTRSCPDHDRSGER